MISIDVKIYDAEVVQRLDTLPRKVRSAVRAKMEDIILELKEKMFQNRPGKFFDQDYIKSGVSDVTALTVSGFIESEDKPGVYSILPTKANLLRFYAKSGDLVFAKAVYAHPFLKSSPTIARLFLESKPWIIEQLETAAIEAL